MGRAVLQDVYEILGSLSTGYNVCMYVHGSVCVLRIGGGGSVCLPICLVCLSVSSLLVAVAGYRWCIKKKVNVFSAKNPTLFNVISFQACWDVFPLIEHRTGTPPTQVRFPGAARDFSPRGNFQCRLSYGIRTCPYANAYINYCVHVKDPVIFDFLREIGVFYEILNVLE